MKIFVYGTLKRGFRAHGFLAGAEYLGDGILNNYSIYDLGHFPGIIKGSGDSVKGEVFQVDQALIERMDRYEGEGYLYKRVTENVIVNGNDEQVYVYVYMQEIEEKHKKLNYEYKKSA